MKIVTIPDSKLLDKITQEYSIFDSMKKVLFLLSIIVYTISPLSSQVQPSSFQGLQLWLSADSGVVLTGGTVSQWSDRSGNGRHAIQGSAGNRPVLVDSVCDLNNKPVIRFNGINNFLRISSFNQAQPMSAFVVWKANGTGAQIAFNGVLVTNRMTLFWNTNNISVSAGAPSIGYTKSSPFNYIISTAIFHNSDTSQLFENGLLRASGNPGSNTLTGLNLGVAHNNASWLNGDIAEVIIYDKEVTPSERHQVELYLRNKYAPPVNLGADTTVAYGFCPIGVNAQKNCFVSYSWSTGATTPGISIVNPGVYSVTAIDVFGFQTADTIVVVRPPFDALNLAPAVQTICVGDSLLLSPSLSPSGYRYSWSSGDTTSQIFVKSTGTYSVTISDSSQCTGVSLPVTLNVDSFTARASLGADTTICSGGLIGLQAGLVSGLSYQWNTNDTTAFISVSSSGTYHLLATTTDQCTFRDTIQVNVSGVAPSVNFSFDSVCSGVPTTFNNQSVVLAPNIIDSVKWEFVSGSFSNQINPVFLFAGSGVYPVSLTAYATGGCFSSLTRDVLVYSNPLAHFEADTLCAGLIHLFQDESTTPPGQNIAEWWWDFAGQGTSQSQHPSFTFSGIGTYPVNLAVTTDKFCTDTVIQHITVVAPNTALPTAFGLISPPAQFSSSSAVISFAWENSVNAQRYRVQVSWDSVFQNMVYDTPVYAHNIHLSFLFDMQPYYWRVVAVNRCEEIVVSPSRSFYVFSPAMITGQRIWFAADTGVILTSGAVSQWSDISGNGFHALQGTAGNRPGLTGSIPILNSKPVIRFDGINDFLRVAVFNQAQPMSAFVVWKANGTGAQIAFNGVLVTNRMTLFWNTNNISVSAGAPSIGYTKSSPFNYIINTAVFHDSDTSQLFENGLLRASGNPGSNTLTGLNLGVAHNNASWLNGDIAEVIIYDKEVTPSERHQVELYLRNKYAPPPVYLGPDVLQNYSLCPITLNAGNRYVSYLWSDSSSLPQLELRKSGTYWVRVVDVFGRISSDTVNVVFPYSGMNVYDTVVCVGNMVNIAPQFSSSGYTYLWSDSSQDSSLSVSVSGDYYVVVSDSSGCSFTSDTVHVLVDSFSFFNLLPADTVICSGNEIALATYQYPVISYLWNTGNDTAVQVVSSSGIYTVTALDMYNCLSSDTISVATSWVAPQTDFSSTNVCLGNTITFGDLSIPVPPDNIRSWQWRFGDGDSAFVQNPAHLFGSIGDYSVQLFLVTDSGCTGILNRMVSVYPYPTASYSYPPIICAGTTVQFVDNSSVLSVTPITSWNWIFDNQDSDTLKNPVYSFTRQGEIPIKFYVSTNQGCVDSLYDTVEVFAPLIADFSFTKSCLGDSSRFTDITNSLSVVKWLWNFGDASFFSSQENPSHLYRFSGDYDVLLTVENAIGCIDTVTKLVTVVDTPSASFQTETACENALYLPIENSISLTEPIQRWDWWIGDSLYQNTVSPQHYFGSTGTYPVKLLVTTASGCVDSVIKSVSVFAGPRADFVFAPLYGEAPLEVNFTNQSSNAVSYSWSFGDGTGSFDLNPSYVYAQNGIYQIFLSVASAEGCVDSLTKQITIIPTDLDLWVDNITLTPTQSGGNEWITIQVRLINSGTRIITSATLYAIPGTGGVIAEEWTGTLLAGQFNYFTFSSQLVIDSRVADTYVCAEAAGVNGGEREVNTDNNRMCASLTENIQIAGPYPNPVTERSVLGVIMPRAGQVRVQITDLLGRKLLANKQYDLPEGRSDIEIPSAQLRAGEYYLQIYYGEEKFTRKFTVLK